MSAGDEKRQTATAAATRATTTTTAAATTAATAASITSENPSQWRQMRRGHAHYSLSIAAHTQQERESRQIKHAKLIRNKKAIIKATPRRGEASRAKSCGILTVK